MNGVSFLVTGSMGNVIINLQDNKVLGAQFVDNDDYRAASEKFAGRTVSVVLSTDAPLRGDVISCKVRAHLNMLNDVRNTFARQGIEPVAQEDRHQSASIEEKSEAIDDQQATTLAVKYCKLMVNRELVDIRNVAEGRRELNQNGPNSAQKVYAKINNHMSRDKKFNFDILDVLNIPLAPRIHWPERHIRQIVDMKGIAGTGVHADGYIAIYLKQDLSETDETMLTNQVHNKMNNWGYDAQKYRITRSKVA